MKAIYESNELNDVEIIGGAIFDISNPVTSIGKQFITDFGNRGNYISGPVWDDYVIAAQSLETRDLRYILACTKRVTGLKVTLDTNNKNGYFRISWASLVLFNAPLIGYKPLKRRVVGKSVSFLKKLLTKALP